MNRHTELYSDNDNKNVDLLMNEKLQATYVKSGIFQELGTFLFIS